MVHYAIQEATYGDMRSVMPCKEARIDFILWFTSTVDVGCITLALLRSILRFPLITPWIFVYRSILRLP